MATPGTPGGRAVVGPEEVRRRRDHAESSRARRRSWPSSSDEEWPVVEEELGQLVGLRVDSVVTSAMGLRQHEQAPAAEPMARALAPSRLDSRNVGGFHHGFRDRSSAAGTRRVHGQRLGGSWRPSTIRDSPPPAAIRGPAQARSSNERSTRARTRLWSASSPAGARDLYSLPSAPTARYTLGRHAHSRRDDASVVTPPRSDSSVARGVGAHRRAQRSARPCLCRAGVGAHGHRHRPRLAVSVLAADRAGADRARGTHASAPWSRRRRDDVRQAAEL